MEPIAVGRIAPDLTLEDILEQEVRIADHKGKKVLLSWHPAAWTGVCGDQMRSLEVNRDKFAALNTVAFGLSTDPAPCKKAWAAVLGINNIPLLCDFWPHGRAARELGVFIEDFGMSQRANIILDEQGVVSWVKVYPLGQLPDIAEVLAVLAER